MDLAGLEATARALVAEGDNEFARRALVALGELRALTA
jgi:hypothetical protein